MSSNKSETKSKIWQLELANKNMELEISARKDIERVLKDREDKFKIIFNQAPIAYFLCDLKGNFVDGNHEAFHLTGYTKEELFGNDFINVNLIDKKEQKTVLELIFRSRRGEYTGPDEFFITKKDGSIAIIELSTSPVTIQGNRQILGVAYEITDRKLTHVRLQESEKRYRKLFDSAHDALMTLNPPTWKFTSGNPAILEMFKVKSVEEFLTYGPWDISPEKQPDGRLSAEKAKEMIEIAMTEGSNYFEWTHKRINGESFSATVLLTRIQLKDETFLQATVRDITEQKRIEKVNNVLIDISNSVNTAQNLNDLYRTIHKLLDRIIDVSNFYIAIIDLKNHTLQFPYHVDTTDDDFSSITNFNTDDSLTGLVVSKRKPIFLEKEELKDRASQKGVWGPTPLIWLGVPLIINNEVIGVVAIQSYKDPNLYNMNDLQILSAVSDQVAIAIDRKRSEDALRISEENYRTFVENANDGITIIQDEKIVFVNTFLANMYGEPVSSIIGKSFACFVHPDNMEMVIERQKMRMSGKRVPNKYRAELINKKKEKIFCDLNVSLTTYNGKPAEQVIVHDTTEDILKEELLKRSEKKYRDLFEKSEDALLIIQNGKFVDCNQATINMLRYKNKKEFLNTHPSELSPEKQPDGRLSSEKADEMMNIAFENGSHRFKWDHKRSDGEIFPVEVLLTSISTDGNNQILHTVWRDITERKKANLELKQSEERFKRLFDDLGDAVYVTKLGGANRGKIFEVNQAAVRQTGYTRNELLKMNIINDIYISGSGASKTKNWEEKLSEGEIFTTTEKKRRKDGKEFWTEVIVSPIQFKGEIAGLSINHDITERKQAEELKDSIYLISEAVHSTENLEELFKLIHQAIGKLVDAKNFYIALYDTGNEMISFPYFVDEYDEIPLPKKLGKGLTEYVLRTGKLLLASPKVFEELVKNGEVESSGAPSIDWLGVPLKTKNNIIGVLVIQSYTEGVRFNEETKEILRFVSNQVAMAIERKQVEKELQESEERFRKLFDSAKDALMTLNPPTWKFTSGNPAILDMFKVKSVEEFLTYGPWDISPEKQPDGRLSADKAKEMIEIAMTKGSNLFEWTHKRINGESFPATVLLTKIQLKDETFLQATVRDNTKRKLAKEEIEQKTKELEKQFKISEKQRVATLSTLSDLNETTKELQFEVNERKKSEKALRENEEKYHSLTENIPLGIYRNTPGATGKFIEVNQALVDMFGFKDREAMLAASASSLYVSPGERKKFSDKVLAKGFVKNEELKLLRQDGSSFIGSSTASAVKDEDGKVIHYDGIIEDITERKELRTQLLESEEKFRSIVNNSPDIILRIDWHGIITYINYEYSNQKPEDIIGKTIYELMPPEFHEKARSTIKKVFKTGESFSFENLGISSDDSVLWYRNNVAALNKDGKVVAATIIVTDISEQKQIEIMRNEFVSSVSHELRTPLTIIRESLSILSDGLFGKLNKEQLDIVNPCMEDVDRLSRIINNLLDISRIEGQKIKLEREMVDIVKLVQSVVSSFENKAVAKNIELVFTPNYKSINLYLDRDRIIQVFMNLIGNSMKFTEEGKIEVFITKKANDVECCITDTGRGIEQKDIGTLFDRFHQVGKVMRAGEKGSGLGLSISKGIVKLHNGRIWVNSKINKGSKFFFALPIYSTDEIIIENIENEIKKVADKHIMLSLLLIKLNNFSKIDSKFGIAKANKVTKLILQIIQDALAPGEFSFMKGKGEVILFSDITKQNIIVLFAKLEDMLAKSVLKIDKDLTIDLSYGYSLYPDNGDNASTLLKNVKKALLKNDKA